MLLIVAHHYVVNSGLMAWDGPIYSNGFSGSSVFLLILGMWGKIGINCFVMITGYFMCKSNITQKKFIKLLLEIYFYRFIIYGVFCITGHNSFSILKLIGMLIPIRSVADNFTGCYLLFYLTIPFLNMLIHTMNKREHELLIALCLFIYVLFGTLKFLGNVRMNYVSWFIVIYFFASYLSLYPENKWNNKRFWNVSLLILIIIDIISVLISFYVSLKIDKGIAYYFVADCNTLLALLTGTAAFMAFLNLKLTYSKIINQIASSTFGVLCIHAHSDTMRQWLWQDLFKNVEHYSSPYLPVYAIGCVLSVFAVCVLIDKVRIRFFEIPVMKRYFDQT